MRFSSCIVTRTRSPLVLLYVLAPVLLHGHTSPIMLNFVCKKANQRTMCVFLHSVSFSELLRPSNDTIRIKKSYPPKPYEPVREKTNTLGSDQVRHKPGCAVTEDSERLEILELESRGIVLSV